VKQRHVLRRKHLVVEAGDQQHAGTPPTAPRRLPPRRDERRRCVLVAPLVPDQKVAGAPGADHGGQKGHDLGGQGLDGQERVLDDDGGERLRPRRGERQGDRASERAAKDADARGVDVCSPQRVREGRRGVELEAALGGAPLGEAVAVFFCGVFRGAGGERKRGVSLFRAPDSRPLPDKKKKGEKKKLKTQSYPRYEGASTAHPRCRTSSLRNGSLIAIVPAFSWKKMSSGPLGGRAPGGRTSQACSLVPSEAESHTSS